MGQPHAVIGILVWVLVMLQPVLGIIHHKQYKKILRRGMFSYAHIWIGRFAITLGIINGGLGFILAGYSGGGVIAYALLAGIVWIIYVFTLTLKKRSRSSNSATEQRTTSVRQPVVSRNQEYFAEK
jgi:hypothetical protein